MRANNFSLLDEKGRIHQLKDYLGNWVILYFYPKDDTPGCTKEACNFRDKMNDLKELGIQVLGVSADSVESHKKFKEKHNLNFPLLSDEKKEVIKDYQAWGKKKFMGKEFEGILRISYLINPQGEIVKKYDKIDPKKHADEVLVDVKKIINSN